jgi:gas vesicle protein
MSHDDDRETESSTTMFLAGVCAGALMGAAAGLLFAPRPGYKLRGQLSRSARRAGRAVSTTVDDLTDQGIEAYERARDIVTHASDEIERVASQASEQIDKGLTVARDLAATRSRRA